MKRSLLEYLVCPRCQIDLACQITAEQADDIEQGWLHCRQCEARYPIVAGVPRFVSDHQPVEGQNAKTVQAFGWQWQEFDHLHDFEMYQAQFLDWIYPIQPDFFRDKVVLDAGCGMGRFSLVSSHFGAKLVLAIDASHSVDAARTNLKHRPNVQVIQADLHHLPLRQGDQAQVDFIFSIGVIHHLDHPQTGFEAVVRHLQQTGTIYVWVYGRENNGWVINGVNPVRTLVTSRLPRWALYGLSWLITLGLQLPLKLIYGPLNATWKGSWLQRRLPYNDYLAWLAQYQFRHNHHVVFDHLVTPVAFYIRREEFETWFREAGLRLIDISWRNRNSWRGHGGFIDQALNKATAAQVDSTSPAHETTL